jgi:murein DD-endopeptidase MepM/ murein hydrolase activator NlpD/Zn-dependent protease with chaperone function
MIGILFFIIVLAVSKFKPFVNIWRDFWLVLIGLSLLPIVFSIVPVPYESYSVLDMSQLHLTFSENEYFGSAILDSKQLTKISSVNILNALAISWLGIYVFGFLYAVIRLVNQIKVIQSIISNAEDVKDSKDLLGEINYKRFCYLQKHTNIEIAIIPMGTSPFVFQLRKKHLVLPQSLFKDSKISQQQIDLIIEHEMVHINNNDPLVVMISHIMVCLLWFNPFVKAFQKNMNWAIEAHCDSEVLNQKPHLRKIYAKTMLKILRESATKTSNHMVAAFSIKTHRSLTMRINNIMKPLHPEVKLKPKKNKLWAGAMSLGLLMFITQPQSHTTKSVVKTEMVNPVKQAKISSHYGAKNKILKFHKGIDLSAKTDTPIVASAAGVVRVSTDLLENKKNYGTIIIIDHADGLHSVYAHLNGRNVAKGEQVEAGQLIGYVGETGKATGPHLHLELLKDNMHVNPSDYIDF